MAERSNISFERAMEMGELVLQLHERGLDLVNIKEKADEWVKNRDDYRSICYMAAPVLAVKLRDALADLQKTTGGEPRGEANPLAAEADPRSRNADTSVEPGGEKIG